MWESDPCRLLQEEMSTWIQAILNASVADRPDVQGSNPGTPSTGRAQTLPATVTLTTESSPGKREKDKEKDKEKRFSLFSKKKQWKRTQSTLVKLNKCGHTLWGRKSHI